MQSMELLSGQTDSPVLAAAARDVALQLSRGQTLSRSLSRHRVCFTATHTALVQVGETSGALGTVFERLAVEEERTYELQQQLRSSLVLPLFITAACLLLVTVVAPLVLGSVLTHLAGDASTLPWPSRLLMLASTLLRSPVAWLLAAVALTGGHLALRKVATSEDGRRQIHAALDRIPALGPLLRIIATIRFLRTLETTIKVGFPLLKSLDLAGSACAHAVLQQRLARAREAVQDGEELHRALQGCEFFPRLVLHGIRAGEESGQLTQMLGFLAAIYQLEVDTSTRTFTQVLEPLVLCLVGGLVGFCVIAALLPLSQLLETL